MALKEDKEKAANAENEKKLTEAALIYFFLKNEGPLKTERFKKV